MLWQLWSWFGGDAGGLEGRGMGRDCENEAICSVRCSALAWGQLGRYNKAWVGNLIRMTELGDTEGLTRAEGEVRELEMRWGGKSSFPSTLRPCADRQSQEQLLPPNSALLVPGGEPAVLRPVRCSGSAGVLPNRLPCLWSVQCSSKPHSFTQT